MARIAKHLRTWVASASHRNSVLDMAYTRMVERPAVWIPRRHGTISPAHDTLISRQHHAVSVVPLGGSFDRLAYESNSESRYKTPPTISCHNLMSLRSSKDLCATSSGLRHWPEVITEAMPGASPSAWDLYLVCNPAKIHLSCGRKCGLQRSAPAAAGSICPLPVVRAGRPKCRWPCEQCCTSRPSPHIT